MPLITCSDCGGKVSTRASACPHCGCPVAASDGLSSDKPKPAEPEKMQHPSSQEGSSRKRANVVSSLPHGGYPSGNPQTGVDTYGSGSVDSGFSRGMRSRIIILGLVSGFISSSGLYFGIQPRYNFVYSFLPGLLFGPIVAMPWARACQLNWVACMVVGVLSVVGYFIAYLLTAVSNFWLSPVAGGLGVAIMLAPVWRLSPDQIRKRLFLGVVAGAGAAVIFPVCRYYDGTGLKIDAAILGVGVWQVIVAFALSRALPSSGPEKQKHWRASKQLYWVVGTCLIAYICAGIFAYLGHQRNNRYEGQIPRQKVESPFSLNEKPSSSAAPSTVTPVPAAKSPGRGGESSGGLFSKSPDEYALMGKWELSRMQYNGKLLNTKGSVVKVLYIETFFGGTRIRIPDSNQEIDESGELDNESPHYWPKGVNKCNAEMMFIPHPDAKDKYSVFGSRDRGNC